MEELQDAIEDAQYVNAISNVDDGPRPVIPWEKPTAEEQLPEWKAKVIKGDKDADPGAFPAFSLEWTLEHALGFFLFSAFLKDTCGDYVQINFVEDVIRWRSTRGRQRSEKARKIVASYLMPRDVDEETGKPKLPSKTEIDEYDLLRPLPEKAVSKEEIQKMVEENADKTCAKCCIGLDGLIRDEIVERVTKRTDSQKTNASASDTAAAPAGETKENGDNVAGNGTGEEGCETPAKVEEGKEEGKEEPSGKDETPAKDEPSGKDEPTSKEEPSVTEEESKTEESKTEESKTENDDAPKEDKKPPRPRSLQHLPDDFFDKAELVVVEMIKEKWWNSFEGSVEHTKLMDFLWYQDRRVVEEDFFVMRVLGRGGFGLVTACKKGTSGKLYAMKVMNKKRIKIKKSEQLTLNERQALASVDSPFVVNLKYAFQSKEDIFLILDLMTGGDLSFHLQQKGRFPKKECLYYAARIMLGLQALHDQQYVYRDLKPENCLLADDGRVKLTDLGLATKVTPTLHGAAGTRGYWAPEMLRRDKKGKRMPYGHSVDWFSFGCVLAEFISGTNPFRSEMALNFGLERGKKTKEKAIDCATLEMDPVFDSKRFDDDAADLCRRLLDKNEKRRLGVKGCEEIMAHPWFRDVNWEMIITDRKRPPFIPPKDVNAASQSEIGTFAEDKTFHETVLDQKDEEIYKNWDW
eukprot:CAMPEP_0197464904 /NCGR_PEP_ID=MMETSP1175-20131217/64267_1 /TAXON_ID=1003142 /ORGANISM="Triceratium dubium, Strain CCMP147" /LENGTH=690 /DNA_ID=CAMNT_0043000907 /DNA_START=995 /DNA_END=3064 /DNA_ORIENTATION=+